MWDVNCMFLVHSLRDGMNANISNWLECTMFVQDLCAAGVNIAAEIPKEQAYNFQGMCQMFSTSQRPSPIKRMHKASPPANQPIRRAVSTSSLPAPKSTANRGKTTKDDKIKVVASNLLKKVPTKKGTVKTPLATIDEVIKNEKIYELIATELEKVSLRTDERVRNETRILGLLKHQFKLFDRTLELTPFGSTTYGFGGSNSNYNIFVDTRECWFLWKKKYFNGRGKWMASNFDTKKLLAEMNWFIFILTGKSQQVQSLVLESFEKYLTKTDIQLNFDGIAEILASRTLKQQLRMIHKESGIHVLLLADDAAVAEAQKVIRDFIAIKPICKSISPLNWPERISD